MSDWIINYDIVHNCTELIEISCKQKINQFWAKKDIHVFDKNWYNNFDIIFVKNKIIINFYIIHIM